MSLYCQLYNLIFLPNFPMFMLYLKTETSVTELNITLLRVYEVFGAHSNDSAIKAKCNNSIKNVIAHVFLDYGSLSFVAVERKALDTKMTTYVTEGARRERRDALVSCVSRTRHLPSQNLKKKRNRSQTNVFQVKCIYNISMRISRVSPRSWPPVEYSAWQESRLFFSDRNSILIRF